MKKFAYMVLAVTALVMAVLPAFADSVITNTFDLTNVLSIYMNAYCNVMAVQDNQTRLYRLVGPDGTDLTEPIYTDVDASGYGPYFRVSTGSEFIGLVDQYGNTIIPEKYSDIDYYSEKWQAAITLTECSSDSYDYKSWSNDSFYMIVSVDMYFEGKLVGTLPRVAYTDYASAMGDYIRIRNRDGEYVFYDKALKKSDYATESHSEYEYVYKTNQVFHVPSGQEAFVPGCTLTADEVTVPYYEVKGAITDLQGNVVFRTPYYVSKITKDYVKVNDSNSRLYGIMDLQGNVIVPILYNSIYDTYSAYDTSNPFGFYAAVKDGKFGYVNSKGDETCEFKYSNDIVRSGDLFSYLQDLTGENIVLSAAVGQFPQTYKEIRRISSSACPLIIVQNSAGEVGVLDLNGNAVIPFTSNISDCYQVEISYDGRLMCARMGDYSNRLYRVCQLEHEYNDISTKSPKGEWLCLTCLTKNAGTVCTKCGVARPMINTEVLENGGNSASPLTGDTGNFGEGFSMLNMHQSTSGWTCISCSSQNSGNFCTNCGTPRPTEDAKTECPNCDYVAPDGETPNFCPQCGTKLVK